MTGLRPRLRRGGRPPAARRDPFGQPPRAGSQDPRRRGGRLLRRRDRARGARRRRARRGHGARARRVRGRLGRRRRGARPRGPRACSNGCGKSWRSRSRSGCARVAAFLTPGRARRSRARRCGRCCARRIEAALAELVRDPREQEGAGAGRRHRRAHRERCVDLGARGCARRTRAAGRRSSRAGSTRGWTRSAASPASNPAALAQEAALMADRLDVSRGAGPPGHAPRARWASCSARRARVGRKLDFVIQEIGRELNTIASKAQDAGVAGAGHRRARPSWRGCASRPRMSSDETMRVRR